MNKRYDLFQSISQRKDRTLSEEDAKLVSIANDIIRATGNCRKDETESGTSIGNVEEINEIKRNQTKNQQLKIGLKTGLKKNYDG